MVTAFGTVPHSNCRLTFPFRVIMNGCTVAEQFYSREELQSGICLVLCTHPS